MSLNSAPFNPAPFSAVREAAEWHDANRFAKRERLFRKIVDQSPQRDFMSDYQQQSMLRSMDSAYRLLSAKERGAFDITL